MDFEIIKVATNNFSDDNKLGQGGFGAIYKVIKQMLYTNFIPNVIVNVICIVRKPKI